MATLHFYCQFRGQNDDFGCFHGNGSWTLCPIKVYQAARYFISVFDWARTDILPCQRNSVKAWLHVRYKALKFIKICILPQSGQNWQNGRQGPIHYQAVLSRLQIDWIYHRACVTLCSSTMPMSMNNIGMKPLCILWGGKILLFLWFFTNCLVTGALGCS